ncbi:MAG: carboxymuconolactone decarboxylase family protein, partial [Planctomycetaceae bacterium]|nr:carboxymuconolactone decarboxylase family protein [Planctomycetaceae bacterium]
ERELEMVAIGAAIGGNCIPCLEYHYKKCVELGFTQRELTKAVAMAKKVKESPNKTIYETAAKLNSGEIGKEKSKDRGCCCEGDEQH